MQDAIGDNGNSQKINLSQSLILSVIQSALLAAFFGLSLTGGGFVYDTNAFSEFLIFSGTVVGLPLVTWAFRKRFPLWSFYTNGLEIFLYGLMIPIFLRNLSLVILVAVSLLLSVLKLERQSTDRWPYFKMFIFLLLSVIMYILGSFLQFIIQPPSVPVILVPLSSIFIFPGQAFPPLYYMGMNLYGAFATITISPLSLLLFTPIAGLVAENYEGFFRILRRGRRAGIRSVLYGVTATLSCQCEACISLLPAMLFVILTVAMIPLILESFLLLVLSNIVIRRYFEKRNLDLFQKAVTSFSRLQLPLAAFMILFEIPVELFGIYLGWIKDPIFFFGMGMLNTLSGYVLIISAGRFIRAIGGTMKAFLLVVSGSVASLVWYLPSLTHAAFTSGLVFSVMVIASLVSGVIFGLAQKSLRNWYLVPEAVSLIYGIFIVAIFYLTVDLRMTLWNEFTYTQTVIFEIFAWTVMLPVMWFFTQVSILRSANDEPPKFYVEQPYSGFHSSETQ